MWTFFTFRETKGVHKLRVINLLKLKICEIVGNLMRFGQEKAGNHWYWVREKYSLSIPTYKNQTDLTSAQTLQPSRREKSPWQGHIKILLETDFLLNYSLYMNIPFINLLLILKAKHIFINQQTKAQLQNNWFTQHFTSRALPLCFELSVTQKIKKGKGISCRLLI